MANEIPIDQLASKIEMAFEVLAREKDSIEIPALKECEGSMKQRIHNRGQDSDGNRIGIKGKNKGLYSKPYEKYKLEALGYKKVRGYTTKSGKDVESFYRRKVKDDSGYGGNLYPINLQLRGDLSKNFTVGVKNETNVLEFQDELSAKKVERHEKSYNTDIYKPSQSEIEGVRDVYILGFKKALEEAFSNL